MKEAVKYIKIPIEQFITKIKGNGEGIEVIRAAHLQCPKCFSVLSQRLSEDKKFIEIERCCERG